MNGRVGIGSAEADVRENLAIPFGAKPDLRNAVFGRDLGETMLEFGLLRFGDMHGAVNRRRQRKQETSENE